MSDSARSETPKAIIHKRILDRAEADPEKSIEALAEEIPGATPDLVDRVLAEYGDPADTDEPSTSNSDTSESMTSSDTLPGLASLSEEQREILEAISERPDANQAELARQLDIGRSTLSHRVNAIEGFDWEHRTAFVADLLEGAEETLVDSNGSEAAITELQERVTELESRVESSTADEPLISDPELVAKIIRACMGAEEITRDEELQIIRRVLE